MRINYMNTPEIQNENLSTAKEMLIASADGHRHTNKVSRLTFKALKKCLKLICIYSQMGAL